MGICLKIKQERKKKRLTQEQLAEKIGVSVKTIVNWENDIVTPSLENCKKLRTIFGITLDDLLEDSIEIKDRYDQYVNLGKEILELAKVDYSIDFIQKYYICSREPSLLIPRKIAEKFISNIGDRIDNTNPFEYEKIKLIQKDMRDFLFFWYKYNKGKHLLAKELKIQTLLINSISYSSEEIADCMNNPISQEKPILLLRNLIIGRLIKECNLLDYEIDEEIDEELNYSGEIMWPINIYK